MNRTFLRGTAAALVTLVALAFVPASTASAHAALQRSTPAANSVLEASPSDLVLDFDEGIEASLASIELFDGDGNTIEVGAPQAGDDATVVTASLPELADGLYAVIWRVTSADGHAVNGAFSFQIGTGATGDGQDLIDQVAGGGGVDHAVKWTAGIARYLSLLGAVLLVGVGVWSVQGRPQLGTRRAVDRTMWVGWFALVLGAPLAFFVFGAQAIGGTLGDAFRPSVWGDVAGTETGRMLLLRIVLTMVLGVALVKWSSNRATWWQGVSASAGVLLIVTFPAAGHPNSLSPRLLWIAIDAAHLAAVVVWVGGLFALLLAGKAWLSEPEAVRPAERFSFTATIAVPVIVITGVAQTLKLAGGLDDVTATTWGRLLLAKTMFAVALIAVGGVSRWLLQHDGAGSLRRTVAMEAVIGLVVIGLAAGMVGQAPRPPVAAQAYEESITASGVIASVSISPGSVGGNEIHVLVTPPGGSIVPVASASARVSLPSAGIPISPVELASEGVNHFSGNVTFPESGDWTLELIVNLTETDSVLLKATVTIP